VLRSVTLFQIIIGLVKEPHYLRAWSSPTTIEFLFYPKLKLKTWENTFVALPTTRYSAILISLFYLIIQLFFPFPGFNWRVC